MKIDDDHMHHGAALIQIAEHPRFTAINSFKLRRGVSRSAYRVNDDIGVYLKYASRPNTSHKEYVFTFRPQHLDELVEIAKKAQKCFVALVCVKDRQICSIPYADLLRLIEARKKAKGNQEIQYTVLVTLPSGKSFRVYMNQPGVKKTMLGKPIIVSRGDFPDSVFS